LTFDQVEHRLDPEPADDDGRPPDGGDAEHAVDQAPAVEHRGRDQQAVVGRVVDARKLAGVGHNAYADVVDLVSVPLGHAPRVAAVNGLLGHVLDQPLVEHSLHLLRPTKDAPAVAGQVDGLHVGRWFRWRHGVCRGNQE